MAPRKRPSIFALLTGERATEYAECFQAKGTRSATSSRNGRAGDVFFIVIFLYLGLSANALGDATGTGWSRQRVVKYQVVTACRSGRQNC